MAHFSTVVLFLSASVGIGSACHAGMARDVAFAVMENAEEGSGMEMEGSGMDSHVDHLLTSADGCLLLSYKCPTGEDCLPSIEDAPGIRSCADHVDYQLRVAGGDGPYVSIRCVNGVWYEPSGTSLEATLLNNPTAYCQRFVPSGSG